MSEEVDPRQASDEGVVRTLITNWARAVHESDLGGVLAHHSEDIVMFDVPPPSSGVRGIAAYAETWPPSVEWSIVRHDVAGGDHRG